MSVNEELLNKELSRLEKWQSHAEKYESLGKLILKNVKQQKELEGKHELATKEQQVLEKNDNKAKKQTLEAGHKLETTSKKLQKLQTLKSDKNELNENQGKLADIGKKLKATRKKHHRLKQAFKKAEKEWTDANKLVDQINGIHSDIKLLNTTKASFDSTLLKRQELEKLKPNYEKAQKEKLTIVVDEKKIAESLEETNEKYLDVERKLRENSFNVEAIQAAVATIASKLTEKDLVCPVCSTSHGKGVLKKIAQESANLNSPQILVLENELKELMEVKNDALCKQEDIIKKRNAALLIESKFVTLHKQINEEIERLQKVDLIKMLNFEDMGKVLSQTIIEAQNRLAMFEKDQPNREKLNNLSQASKSAGESLHCEIMNINQLEPVWEFPHAGFNWRSIRWIMPIRTIVSLVSKSSS